jgi:transcription termination/antitermination protein NusA
MIRKMFELEVPEIFAGTVEIKSIAREAGERTKIAVSSTEEGVDPIGSCVGQKGTRVQAVIDELGGEKIDIILWNDDIAKFISSALSPAKVLKVEVREAQKEAAATVPEDQLSLAIGKRGQNVRLAAKLTGWKIDILGVKADGEAAEKKKDAEKEAEKKAEEETAEVVEKISENVGLEDVEGAKNEENKSEKEKEK